MKNPIILKNLFTLNVCNNIIDYICKKTNIDFEPFSNSPYRSSFTKNELSNIDNEFIPKIEKLVSKTLGDNFIIDTITVHYKDKWVGAEEHWHQDYPYNLINYDDKPDNFYRLFIALDEHTEKNGCMIFIENSHKEGILEHEKILSIHSYQKNRAKTHIIDDCYKKYGIKYFSLAKGSGILFNSLILHSSCSNQSPYSRKAIQIQFVKENTKKKLPSEISNFFKNRKLFEINELKKRIGQKMMCFSD
jgi:ectoine hydroxylase-related dioxygenase (phytanoyl-CoA dioxygenase family)